MINIRTDRTKYALNLHRKGLKGELVARAKKRLRNADNSLPVNTYNTLLNFIKAKEEKIITNDVANLKTIQQDLFNQIPDSLALRNDLDYILSYKWFRDYKVNKHDGFKLAKALSIDVCPYCNRNYTTSHRIEGKSKNVYPEFDHYYPKSSYPLLMLSFFNLIPSCNICNTHFKGSDDPDAVNTFIYYPYSDFDAVKSFNFEFTPLDYSSLIGKSTNFETAISTAKSTSVKTVNDLVTGSLEYFDIIGTYNANHKGLIKELINKRINYSDSYIESVEVNYGISKDEAYSILFEAYYEDQKLMKRPFSKLKKDIFNEIESLS